MNQKINWTKVLLIMGLSFALIGVHFIVTFYTIFSGSYDILPLLVKKGTVESFIGILFFVVVMRNTTLKDIKRILRDLKPYIVVSCFFLVLGIVVGIFLQSIFHDFAKSIFEEMAEVAERLESVPPYGQTLFILGNNFRVAVLSGVIAFIPLLGILLPISIMGLNGAVIGFAPGILGMSGSDFAIAILPHGIFEIPALVLASAVGLRFAIASIKASIGFVFHPRGVSGKEVFLREIRPGWLSIKLFALIIPLLIIAALMEVTVTPRVMLLYGL